MGSISIPKSRAFKRILIANRGEIACRIEKTCRRLGIETVAVGSTIDQGALHMQMADRAVIIGPAQAQESYLNGDAILQAAIQEGAEAIHPGYGFLSENADFAEKVRDAGLIFIGPSTKAIREMGSKSKAKSIAQSVHVPVLPGYEGEGDLAAAAQDLGFPLLIKATFGGGGKGMRRVNADSEFEAALSACRREAKAAFGSDCVILEKYLERPRHVEVQILGDSYGKCIVLADRDCSLQRRRQKVIEEAPAPLLPRTLRNKLHDAALAIAQSVAYENLGTVEFLVGEEGTFFFLEMNTRLQVEHPVTEMILGLDLVEWQVRAAFGEPLDFDQRDIQPCGHAIEARLYAEDGDNGFLPSTGTITRLNLPMGDKMGAKNVRVDAGIQEGDAVAVYYDPLIAKIIAWGPNREEALKQLADALAETRADGIKSNLNFLRHLLRRLDLLKAPPDIGFIDQYVYQNGKDQKPPDEAYMAAALWLRRRNGLKAALSPWNRGDGWRLNAPAVHYFHFVKGGEVSLRPALKGMDIDYGGKRHHAHPIAFPDENEILLTIEGAAYRAQVYEQDEDIYIQWGEGLHRLKQGSATAQGSQAVGPAPLIAPMPGRVTSVLAALGDAVEVGQPLMIVAAMKMEHTICAPHAGIVDGLSVKPGDFCEEGMELARLRSLTGTPAAE